MDDLVRTALVTGGAGFIGSHLADRLLTDGWRVRALDNLDALVHPHGRRPHHLASEVELVVADVRDRAAVGAALEGVDVVFHLGGVVGNGESMVNVRRAVEANSTGTATLLEAILARRERIRRLVVASSMVVYGEGAYRCRLDGEVAALRTPEQLRRRRWEPLCPRCRTELEPVAVREELPLRPTSVYGITKRDQEELALTLGRAYGLEVVALRYLGVYGPRQALTNPYTGVAALFAARALSGRSPRVFEDGGQIRDLVAVADVAEATARAADAAAAAAGEAINVASGRRVRILELARRVCVALGADVEPEVTGEFRAGDIRHCFADTERARELLGFTARRTLDEAVPELAEWVRRQRVAENGDAAVAELRERGLVG